VALPINIMANNIKRFIEWIIVKIWLERSGPALPLIREGDIWWCSLGENIATEIGGKGDYFRRPVIVFVKLDSRSFLGIPLTSQTKRGSWYFPLRKSVFGSTAIMAQTRYLDSKRLDKRIGSMSQEEFESLRKAFVELIYHNKSPAYCGRVDAGNPELDKSLARKS
jgi:mRNA interferase MazF